MITEKFRRSPEYRKNAAHIKKIAESGDRREKEQFVYDICSVIDYWEDQIAHGAVNHEDYRQLALAKEYYRIYLEALKECTLNELQKMKDILSKNTDEVNRK